MDDNRDVRGLGGATSYKKSTMHHIYRWPISV